MFADFHCDLFIKLQEEHQSEKYTAHVDFMFAHASIVIRSFLLQINIIKFQFCHNPFPSLLTNYYGSVRICWYDDECGEYSSAGDADIVRAIEHYKMRAT